MLNDVECRIVELLILCISINIDDTFQRQIRAPLSPTVYTFSLLIIGFTSACIRFL